MRVIVRVKHVRYDERVRGHLATTHEGEVEAPADERIGDWADRVFYALTARDYEAELPGATPKQVRFCACRHPQVARQPLPEHLTFAQVEGLHPGSIIEFVPVSLHGG